MVPRVGLVEIIEYWLILELVVLRDCGFHNWDFEDSLRLICVIELKSCVLFSASNRDYI